MLDNEKITFWHLKGVHVTIHWVNGRIVDVQERPA